MKIFQSAGMLNMSDIKLSNFYGIELDDFAHEVAILSLWLAQHQMNIEFKKTFGDCTPTLPLQDGGNIVQGNATRLEWDRVCPKNDGDEIYIFGNPPYLDSSRQSIQHKEDMKFMFKNLKNYKKLDYIACWFYKGASYIKNFNAKFAFVSTNSLCQGEQVSILWNTILSETLEFYFAYQSFKWKNNAKANAGVTVVIIGISNISNSIKNIYVNNFKKQVKNISYYLIDTPNIIIKEKSKSFISNQILQRCGYIDKSDDLFLNESEYIDVITANSGIKKFIRKLIGGKEMIRGINKYAFWIDNINEANKFQIIKDRLNKVKLKRNNDKPTHKFCNMKEANKQILVVPRISSENRNYLPISFFDKNVAVNDSVVTMYDPEEYIFGIISSNMHMVWMRAVTGRLKTDYRYSSSLVYNTFPFPKITQTQKK